MRERNTPWPRILQICSIPKPTFTTFHIPYPGSDTWVWERWEEITPETMVEIDREGGRVACEGCGKEPRRIVRVTEKERN